MWLWCNRWGEMHIPMQLGSGERMAAKKKMKENIVRGESIEGKVSL